METEVWDAAIAAAAKIGAEHGGNAASWWEQDAIGGRASGDVASVARAVLAGIEDGDPAVLDGLPAPDLSGQWADGYTPARLMEDCDIGDENIGDVLGELCDAYEQAFQDAATDAVAESCRRLLAG